MRKKAMKKAYLSQRKFSTDEFDFILKKKKKTRLMNPAKANLFKETKQKLNKSEGRPTKISINIGSAKVVECQTGGLFLCVAFNESIYVN